MEALNAYFRKHHPQHNRDVIAGASGYDYFPDDYPEQCPQRDYSKARKVTIHPVVATAKEKTRDNAGIHLERKALRFADIRDLAIVTGIHACKNGGDDILQGLYVRVAIPGWALETIPSDGGVVPVMCHDSFAQEWIAAAGCPNAGEPKSVTLLARLVRQIRRLGQREI